MKPCQCLFFEKNILDGIDECYCGHGADNHRNGVACCMNGHSKETLKEKEEIFNGINPKFFLPSSLR